MELLRFWTVGIGVRAAKLKEEEAATRRRRALLRLDRELEQGNCKAALALMKQFKAHPIGFLRGFGDASAVHKASGSVSSFDLGGKNDISSLQLAVDAMLHSIKRSLDFQRRDEESEVSSKDFGKATDADSCDSIT